MIICSSIERKAKETETNESNSGIHIACNQLSNLEYLDLRYNKLKYLEADELSGLTDVYLSGKLNNLTASFVSNMPLVNVICGTYSFFILGNHWDCFTRDKNIDNYDWLSRNNSRIDKIDEPAANETRHNIPIFHDANQTFCYWVR